VQGDQRLFRPRPREERNRRRDDGPLQPYANLELPAVPAEVQVPPVDGWGERDDKASLIFGRVFQKALEAHFLGGGGS